MPYVNVNDAYILDNTGKQVDDAVDYALANSNRNLLDNPWMTQGNVINQRGQASYPSTGYTIDRWENSNASAITSVAIGNNGVTLTKALGSFAFYRQYLGRKIDEDATYTLSLMTGDGKIYSATRQFVAGTASETVVSINGMNIGFGLYGKGSTPWVGFYFGTEQRGTITIKAVKLELGSYSTLANDVPPDYGEELRKCQRYFLRLNSVLNFPYAIGIAHNASSLRLLIPTPTTMRQDPKASFTGSLVARGNGSSLTVSSLSNSYLVDNGVALDATTTGATQYQTYSLVPTSSGYIDLSADIQ